MSLQPSKIVFVNSKVSAGTANGSTGSRTRSATSVDGEAIDAPFAGVCTVPVQRGQGAALRLGYRIAERMLIRVIANPSRRRSS